MDTQAPLLKVAAVPEIILREAGPEALVALLVTKERIDQTDREAVIAMVREAELATTQVLDLRIAGISDPAREIAQGPGVLVAGQVEADPEALVGHVPAVVIPGQDRQAQGRVEAGPEAIIKRPIN